MADRIKCSLCSIEITKHNIAKHLKNIHEIESCRGKKKKIIEYIKEKDVGQIYQEREGSHDRKQVCNQITINCSQNESELHILKEKLESLETVILNKLDNLEQRIIKDKIIISSNFPKLSEYTASNYYPSEEPAIFWKQIYKAVERELKSEGIASGTIRNYKSALSCMAKAGFKPKDLASKENFLKIANWIRKKDKIAKNVYIAAAKTASNICYKLDNLPRVKCRIKKRFCYSCEELEKVIDEISMQKPILAMDCLFLYITGLRFQEAKRLSIADFPNLFVENFAQEKSTSNRPLILITSQFKKYSEALGWVKISNDNSWINKQLKNFKEKLNCHSFRHGFVTKSVQNEKSLAKTSKLLGHSSTKITEGYIIPGSIKENQEEHEERFTLDLPNLDAITSKAEKRKN